MPMCGACCKLGDFDLDVLEEMLKNEADVVEYLSMIGEDGWCKYFDSVNHTCRKYEKRPRFCRVTADVFEDLYEVRPSEPDEFAMECCVYHIGNIYGEDSQEMERFTQQCGIKSSLSQSLRYAGAPD